MKKLNYKTERVFERVHYNLLIVLLVVLLVLGNIGTVDAGAKYNYSKYNATQSSGAPYTLSWVYVKTETGVHKTLYTSYSFNSSNGSISTAGERYEPNLAMAQTMYNSVVGAESLYGGYGFVRASIGGGAIAWYGASIKPSISYVRGSLIQSNIIAEDGTYPTNGRHSDGYWYVRGTLANTTPTLTITNTTSHQTINNSDEITISGIITDPDNDTITISATIGGVEKSTEITGPANNEPWKLAWTGAELAEGIYNSATVTANDNKGGTDTKNHTGTKIVDKTPPTLEIKVKTD